MRPPSSTDVARLAGVSQSAVSRTFTPGASVSPETKTRILAAAEELGYTPTALPRIMQTGRSSIVAIVVGGLYNPYFMMALDAFSTSFQAAGNHVMIVRAESDSALDDIVGDLARYRVDAVVSALSIRSQAVADTLTNFKIPVVTLNSGITSETISTVSSDNHGAGELAARLFTERGRRRLGYLAGHDSRPQTDREAGFFAGAEALGQPAPLRAVAGFDYADGRAGALALFGGPDRPDALFCVNDLVACGAIDALRDELGLRVPEDVCVIGYDDIAMASWGAYRLTSFNQDIPALLRGVEAILAGTVSERAILVPPRLIERATAGWPPPPS
ncbi:LacI family DNA-binding transcriptional regulator [Sphingomonas abietis]|uniref:LacI family DNA-binding transcriptional regulator n=1 Tax=Sphingomonas abietis TaxID=3012344 RepID=A0ABY7NLG0_9SPHN|nr:LacI family DNA-binding transcriptional regulator [Sphingomonas abietis]WBO21316.1 LacI family DNA-binding transcriptional regulator [Sphingomonas abietis]